MSESRAACNIDTVPPAIEKRRSEGTEVAGEHKTRGASVASLG